MDKKEGTWGQQYFKAGWLRLALCTLCVDMKTVFIQKNGLAFSSSPYLQGKVFIAMDVTGSTTVFVSLNDQTYGY